MILAVREELRLMGCSNKAENISKLLHEISIISDYIHLVLASRATREEMSTEVSYFGDLQIS